MNSGAPSGPRTARTSSARPDEGRPLLAVGVGILAGRKRAVGREQLAGQVVERPDGDVPVARDRRSAARRGRTPGPAGRCRRASARSAGPARPNRWRSGGTRRRAGRGSRRRPSRRGSAAPSPAPGRRPRRRCPAQQELDGHRLGELRGAAPAAVARVERALERGDRRHERGRPTGSALGRPVAAHCRARARCSTSRDRRPRSTSRRSSRQARATPSRTCAERGHPVARLVGEVGSAVERPAVRGQEDAHRPAAATGHRLDRAPCRPGRGRAAPRDRP